MRTLFDDLSDPDEPPAAAGQVLAELCADKAEGLGWDRDAAARFVVAYLDRHGPTSGEVLVSAASGVYRPHDGRAYGAVLGGLSRRGVIRKAGYAVRTKGHRTFGAIVWELAGPVPLAGRP